MMIPSLFLRRALQADAIFSGTGAVIFSLGAGVLAPLFNLPEALLRETGLFLIAYAAFVGWLGTRQIFPEDPGRDRRRRQCSLDACEHRASVQRRGDAEPAR